jgi:hypothetical protein
MKKQSGQALTEFLVIAMVLLPLFLLVPMIGKYQELAHMTQMASRYAAFDATSFGDADGFNHWKPPAQLADEVRRRFYSNADAWIKTGDVAGDFDANRNVFWRDPYGHALIAKFSDVSVSFGNGATAQAGGFDKASGADGKLFNAEPLANANTIGLQARGIYTAQVGVALANLPTGIHSVAPFDALDLRIVRHTSLLFDPWSAVDTEKTEDRVAMLAPAASLLSKVELPLNVAIKELDLGKVGKASFADLQPWRDVVPADRLVPDAAGTPP